MRILARNKSKFYYAVYSPTPSMVYRDGKATGEYTVGYDAPVECYANIGVGTGDSQAELFGLNNSDYDKLILTDDLTLPIEESTVLWIDTLDITKPYDYIVKKVAKSLNVLAIAVKKVDVKQ